jgi:hypothetical protein
VPAAHEGAAQVLDVDVAPRPGEHVPVRHEQLHEANPSSTRARSRWHMGTSGITTLSSPTWARIPGK